MSNCVGCIPGPSCGACDCGGNCGDSGYKPTDFAFAVSSKDACRYPPPAPVPLLEYWKVWWASDADKTVRVNDREQGTVVAIRERDMMLEVEVEAGRFLFPMRTTEVVG